MTTGASARPEVLPRSPANPFTRYWWMLLLIAGGWYAALAKWPNNFFVLGINHYEPWFLDTFAVLASSDAQAMGLDPYQPNPLDSLHRPHVYSHWWFALQDFGLTRADTPRIGLALAVAFLALAIVRLRPRSPMQTVWYLSFLAAPPVMLGVERGNNDLLIFILFAALVPLLRSPHAWVRRFAPAALVAFAAGLKYYPAAAAVLLLTGDDRHETRRRLFAGAVLLAFVGLSVAGDLAKFGPIAPRPAGLLSFGANATFSAFGLKGPLAGLLGVAVAALIAAVAWRKRLLGIWQPTPKQESDWLHFLLGASLLTGCFFTSMNFGYRWIFAIWMAPLLWVLPGDLATPPGVRRFASWTGALLFVALWWDPVCCLILNANLRTTPVATIMKYADYCVLAEQPVAWALFALLIVFITHFAQRQLRIVRKSR